MVSCLVCYVLHWLGHSWAQQGTAHSSYLQQMDSLRRRIPFKAAENKDDEDEDVIYDEQRVFN